MTRAKMFVCLVTLAIGVWVSLLFAQETADQDGQPRFLMLLKNGDFIGYKHRPDWGGYDLTILSEQVFRERTKSKEEREKELHRLSEERKVYRQEINSNASKSDKDEFKSQRDKMSRYQYLFSVHSNALDLGRIAFVGEDYVTINDEAGQDTAIPLHRIASIARFRPKPKAE